MGTNDKTAYLEEQKDWGKEREHRPAILFEFKKPQNAYPPTNPPRLTYTVNGTPRIVIDVINNNPLRHFCHLPLTVSTKVEGWLQEAWFRQDPSLQAEDLIQRMPYTADHDVYKDRKIINRLVRRRELFRNEGRCLSWKKTTYEKQWDLRLIDEMNNNPNPADPNSTRHLNDLSTKQIIALKDETYATGKHLARGGRRTLKGDKREEKDRVVQERRATRPSKTSKTASNRNSDDANLDGEQTQGGKGESNLAQKRTAHCTATVLPQQQASPSTVVHHSSAMSTANVQSVNHPTLTDHFGYGQGHSDLAAGDHGGLVPVNDNQGGGFPPSYWTSGNQMYAEPGFRSTNEQHREQPRRRQPMSLTDQQNMVGLYPESQQFQGYGGHDPLDNHLGGLLDPWWSCMPSSSIPTQRTLSQPATSAVRFAGEFAGETLNSENQIPAYLPQTRTQQGRTGNGSGRQIPATFPYLGHDSHSCNSVTGHSTYGNPEQYQFGLMRGLDSSTMLQQLPGGTSTRVNNYTRPDIGPSADGNQYPINEPLFLTTDFSEEAARILQGSITDDHELASLLG